MSNYLSHHFCLHQNNEREKTNRMLRRTPMSRTSMARTPMARTPVSRTSVSRKEKSTLNSRVTKTMSYR